MVVIPPDFPTLRPRQHRIRRRAHDHCARPAAHGGRLPRHVGAVRRGIRNDHPPGPSVRKGRTMTGGVIIAYVVLLVLVGLYSARQVRTESDYLVAGRQLGPIVLGATLPATQMSAGTAIGTVGF